MRFMGLAVGDTVGTFMLAWLIARATGWAYLPTFIGLFILGEVLHWYFCVDSAFLNYISKDSNNSSTGESPSFDMIGANHAPLGPQRFLSSLTNLA
jgi:hypothetical protein